MRLAGHYRAVGRMNIGCGGFNDIGVVGVVGVVGIFKCVASACNWMHQRRWQCLGLAGCFGCAFELPKPDDGELANLHGF